ncbi:MAG: hypothetical protein N2235_05550 [Fischerella sp.]|nr:hypothetical protein [Fischerella sp.]
MNFAKVDGLSHCGRWNCPDTEMRGSTDTGKISKQFTASAFSKTPQLGIVKARNGSRVCVLALAHQGSG